MRTPVLALAASLTTLCIASYATDAKALGPIDLEIAAKGGYATSSFGGPTNVLGAAIGGRAGVAWSGLYGGINLLYYFGGSSINSFEAGGELGYGFKLGILTLRPQVGLGNITTSGLSLGTLVPGSTGSFYVEPGGVLMISLGLMFIGADANALILTESGSQAAFTAHAQVGVKF